MKFKVILATLILILSPVIASAQIPFGGQIVSKPFWCTCNGALYFWVLDLVTKVPTPMVFQFGFSRLNMQYNIFTPGVELVGTYSPGGLCFYWTGKSCQPKTPSPIGVITSFPLSGVGTSNY